MRHHVEKTLPYRPEDLFAMVGDVAAYPQFVPWVRSLRTWNHRTGEGGVDQLDAEVAVGFAMLKERFATRVSRDAGARQVDVSLISGPFRHLRNRWRFHPHGDAGARIEFDIDFEFKSAMLERLLKANFETAVDRLMACFEARAESLFGSAGRSA